MLKTIRLICIPLLMALCACTGNEFTISFDLTDDMNTTFTVVYYASSKKGGMMVESVASVINGKGEFKGVTRNPTLVFIYGGGISQTPDMVLYVERGDKIRLSGEGRRMAYWSVEGSKFNERWNSWRNQAADTLSGGDRKLINFSVANYVESHPSDPVSALLLLTSYSRRDNEQGFASLRRSLTGDAADPEWSQLVARADLLEPMPAAALLKSIVMRSADNGVDTIRPSKARGSLLMFWNNGPGRRVAVDSLKALAKEFPDSSRRVLADICLEPDSVNWRSSLRYDTLKNVCRLWAPAGLADSRLMALGVTASPYYMVVDTAGVQAYRGRDIEEAVATFRRLMKRSAGDSPQR